MDAMETMPTYTYAIIGGVVAFMVLMMIIGMRKSFARAKGATQDLYAGLQGLGLKETKRDGAKSQLQGTYRGRSVAMHIDGSAVAKAGKKAMRGSLLAAAKEMGSIGGIGGGDDASDAGDDWEEEEGDDDDERDESVQKAAMVMRWAVVLPLDSPVAVKVGHSKKYGAEIGSKLYATFDEQARAGMTNPQVVSALSDALFNSISVKGKKVMCTWSPPMKEYQKYSGSNEAFTQVSQRALDALCTMCDALYGPAA